MNNVYIIGNCEKMLRVFSLVRKFSKVDYPVLITGETGTGKELIAKAIYEKSARNNKPFVAINCGSIPNELFESELFGYEKGAFTSAGKMKKGKIESADKGILFLDEIGELPSAAQPKLLRFLESGETCRLGSNSPIKVDVRIIAATNMNLEKAVKNGRFRDDLFHRLSSLIINLPPLRERDDDVVVIAKYFLEKFSREVNKKIKGFTQGAVEALKHYDWPGNIRELINRLRRAVVLTEEDHISESDLNIELPTLLIKPLSESLWEVEKNALINALRLTEGNVSKAAKKLLITRPTLHNLMKKHRIRVDAKGKIIENEKRLLNRTKKDIEVLFRTNGKEVKGKINDISSKGVRLQIPSNAVTENIFEETIFVTIPNVGTGIRYQIKWADSKDKYTHIGLKMI